MSLSMSNIYIKLSLCFVFHLIMGLGWASSSIYLNNFTSFTYCISVPFAIYFITKSTDEIGSIKLFSLTIISIHLGIILGIYILDSYSTFLWVTDSMTMHVPGSSRLLSFLEGRSDTIERINYYDRTYLAHVFGAISFKIFGENHFASAIGLIVPRILTTLLIFWSSCKLEASKKSTTIVCLIYCFLPTVIFYTTTFYKEATVQLWVALSYFLFISLIKDISLKNGFLLLVSLVCLGYERHYLAPFIGAGVFFFILFSKRVDFVYKILGVVMAIVGHWAFTSYYRDLHLSEIVDNIIKFKGLYSQYSDVSEINKVIPFPLGSIKLLFSPFPTFIKFKTYTNISTLITWSFLVYHLVVLTFLYSIFRLIRKKKNIVELFSLLVPFIIFILMFGYIAPYNGRTRDSFLPLVLILIANNLDEIIANLKNRFIRKNHSDSST